MVPLTGYVDRLSARPGDTLAFKVSSAASEPVSARLVRVISADPNPAGLGIREVDLAGRFTATFPSRVQAVHLGSYAEVEAVDPIAALTSVTVVATIWPTTPGRGEQGLISRIGSAGAGFALGLAADGSAEVLIGKAGGEFERVATGTPLEPRAWAVVWASFDAASGELAVGQAPYGRLDEAFVGRSKIAGGRSSLQDRSPLIIAAYAVRPSRGHYNGKIERPAVFDRALGAADIARYVTQQPVAGLVALWDFSREMATRRIIDVGPYGLHGALVNLPARAMTGANWTGREMCWRHAGEQYGAIHFHDDDIQDCGWETDFTFTVPADLRSGIYAMRLRSGAHEDTIPFFVCPPKGRTTADLLIVIPTFTYIVYANHARPDFGPTWRKRWDAWKCNPWNPAEHRDYGLSTYNFHSDGSGIAYSSSLRPVLNWRSGYITYAHERGVSGLRHFQADSHLWAWAEAKGIAFDVLTDQELHEDGVAALKPYRAVLTCSHPEYHTEESLDAYVAYRDQGGRLVYLGGNGFYWRVALSKHWPGAIEIRRAEGGIRAWAAEPGEYYHAFDGAYGGLWRRNGRPPQKLAGVGFTAQGQFEGSYYRRRPDAENPRAAWMLAGVADDRIGDFGFSGGGAAGFELDRADKRLGTPEHALVVASSEGHRQEIWVLVHEEQLTHITTLPGEPIPSLIRADMTFFEAPKGGAVFSTGSITFCGSLPWNGFDNNVSRLLENVVRRFLDPKPFEIPA